MKNLYLVFFIYLFLNSKNTFADFGYDLCLYKANQSKITLKVPTKIDEVTTLVDIKCIDSIPTKLQFQNHYANKLNNLNKPLVDDYMKKNVFPNITKTWCTNPDFFRTLEMFDIEFTYNDMNGLALLSHKVSLKDCSDIIKN